MFLYLISHFFCLFIECRELLAKVASRNDNFPISMLLEAQNADGQTALHLACRRGSSELVRAILEYREADVDVLDKDGDPPLVFALAAGSPECVRALIERGANVRSRLREGFGPSVAHVCAYHGQPDCMRVGLQFIMFIYIYIYIFFYRFHIEKNLYNDRSCYWLELIQMQLMMKVNLYCTELFPRNIQIVLLLYWKMGVVGPWLSQIQKI